MSTINISIPDKLKNQAQKLVKKGYYSSFSDLVRDSLRKAVSESKYDVWADEARQELLERKAKVLKSKKDIDKYIDRL